MKESLITTLRNRETSMEEFRRATDQLSAIMAIDVDKLIPKTKVQIETPIAKAEGVVTHEDFVLVPILRSGITMLNTFMRFFPDATVGFIGERRDEKTAIAEQYYINLPKIHAKSRVLLLDPMVATGGSSVLAVQILKNSGASENNIILVSFFGAPEGIERLKKECPQINVLISQIDERLNAQKWIVPGLGDFGDRYFGTQ